MKPRLLNIALLISMLILFACFGQVKKPEQQNTRKMISAPMPENGFSTGMVDHQGHLWFGSQGGGLFHFNGKTFSQFTEQNGLNSNYIFSIIEDKDQNIWLGTQQGLTKYDGEHFEHIPLPFQDTTSVWLDQVYPIINPNAAHSIIQDNQGDFWIGTGGGGAFRYDGKTFTSFLKDDGMKYEDSLHHNWIPDIKEDLDGNIWFASMSYGGLTRYDGNSFQTFLRQDGLSDDMIRQILVAKTGKLWLGFNGNRKSALTVYDGEAFSIFPLNDNTCHRNIRALYEDTKGNIWIGGINGICILSDNNFNEFLDANGYAFSDITFIIGHQKDIWFGGKNGIWKFDGQEVTSLITN